MQVLHRLPNFSAVSPLRIEQVEAWQTCHGDSNWLDDSLTQFDWEVFGYGDCSETSDGWVKFTFPETNFVTFVSVFTPSTGR